MIDEDARDLAIHQSIDALVNGMMFANGWTRGQAIERLIAFAENDDESPVFCTAPGKARRRRRVAAEARA